MHTLVLGSGGREHAIVRALQKSKSVTKIWAAPGNDGMQVDLLAWNILKPIEWVDDAKRLGIELIIIGPDEPVALGVADVLREHGFLVFGASGSAARLESSKIFAKEFMLRSNIPAGKFEIVDSVLSLKAAASKFSPPYVLKAEGLAAGKGVVLCDSLDALLAQGKRFFEDKVFGDSGNRALLEEYLPGVELSFHIFTNGQSWQALPLSQDHKRLLDDDQGPNTGGMGTVAPLEISDELRRRIETEILDRVCAGLVRERLFYRGVLYVGLMVTQDGPKVIEFNARFGDPETQVLLPLIDGDLGQIFSLIGQGQLPSLKFNNENLACVVLASPGYPDSPKKGLKISGLNMQGQLAQAEKNVYVIHAGSRFVSSEWVTNGGRVLNIIGSGADLSEALKKSYQAIAKIQIDGMQFRRDIGARAKI